MRLLFIIDAPQTLNPKKDSTLALMRAALARGDSVYYAEIHHLLLRDNAVYATARKIDDINSSAHWQQNIAAEVLVATTFDVVLMRKEPPVDEDFVMATRLLDIINRSVPVVNHPRALREQNEKLSILNFPDLIAPTWVGADIAALEAFFYQHGRVVLKPLNGMGGQGIYISNEKEDLNFRSVADMLTLGGKRLIMAQAYLPAARQGDFRVFAVNGSGLKWMLARIPRSDDHRGNMAAGGIAEARPLDAAAKHIVDIVAPVIAAQGVRFAGLDVIGGKLIEINITCPTGLCEVSKQTGDNIAATVLEAMTAPQ